jgi:hypothetical protein
MASPAPDFGEVSLAVREVVGLLDQQVDGFGAAVAQPAGVEVGQDGPSPPQDVAGTGMSRRDRSAETST